ncbi:hypothetical protein OKHIL_54670 [Mycolicibacterium mageritense]
MAEFGQAAAQVADIDTLAAAVGLAAIGEQRDTHDSTHLADGIALNWENDVTPRLQTLWTCVQTIV